MRCILSFFAICSLAILVACGGPSASQRLANEAAAAATLKSGFFPAQITFQGAAYRDIDNNNDGEYAEEIAWLAGATDDQGPSMALNLLSSNFNQDEPVTVHGYTYVMAVGEKANRQFSVVAFPAEAGIGARAFAISQTCELIERPFDAASDAPLTASDAWSDAGFSTAAAGWTSVKR